MISNIVEVLREGIYLTVVGMGAVAFALSLIILSVKFLNWLFPAREPDESQQEEQEPDKPDEVPSYVLAAVAVEHERRRSTIGTELQASQEISSEYMSEGRSVRG